MQPPQVLVVAAVPRLSDERCVYVHQVENLLIDMINLY